MEAFVEGAAARRSTAELNHFRAPWPFFNSIAPLCPVAASYLCHSIAGGKG